MISMKLSSAIGATIILITIAFLLSSDSDVANAADQGGLIPLATFPGANVGGISDGTSPCWNPGIGTARNITFNAAGLGAGPPTNVELSMTWGSPNHTFVGDITAILIAPNGASHTLFGHTLATTATAFGDSSDLGAAYVFKDTAAAPPNGGWWQAATTAGAAVVMPTGDYRTTNSGGAGAVNPQPPTNMDASFMGVANPNGTWTLRVTDGCAGDTGAITAASLNLTGGPVTTDANVDLNGDHRTDYVVARGTNTPLAESTEGILPGRGRYSSLDERPARTASDATASIVPEAPPIFWYTLFNNSATTSVQQWGDAATDFITPEDFDGDGKDDLTIWRPVPGGAEFWTYQSATNTALGQAFGQDGDDPAVVGDYDGDNKADVAVFRCPPITDPDGQCHFFFRGSLNNPNGNITYIPWGLGVDGDFFPNVGDFDGDGKYDFCLQRANPSIPANGQFVLLKSADLGVEFINWGTSSDFIIPGDYDGDQKADFCVRRTVSGVRNHYILYRTGATSATVWGITGDSSAPGDYDGDGKTDIAIWRGSTTPGSTGFWVLNSSNGAAGFTPWGQCATVSTCDFAVAGWAVH